MTNLTTFRTAAPRGAAITLLCLLAAWTPNGFAQTLDPCCRSGLVAGLAVGAADITIGDASGTRALWMMDLGWRIERPSGLFRAIQLTPKVALSFTDVRGSDPEVGRFAYGSFGLGLRTSVRMKRVKLIADVSRETQVAEVPRRNGLFNYSAAPQVMTGVGLEIPLTPQGRGIQVMVRRVSGTFTTSEQAKQVQDIQVPHKNLTVVVGWSGRFTGISLPWR